MDLLPYYCQTVLLSLEGYSHPAWELTLSQQSQCLFTSALWGLTFCKPQETWEDVTQLFVTNML